MALPPFNPFFQSSFCFSGYAVKLNWLKSVIMKYLNMPLASLIMWILAYKIPYTNYLDFSVHVC